MNSSITNNASWTESGSRRRPCENSDLPGRKATFREELIQCSFHIGLPLVFALDLETQSGIFLVMLDHGEAVLDQESRTRHARWRATAVT